MRKPSLTQGNRGNWTTSAGSDVDDCEWLLKDADAWNDLGRHAIDVPNSSSISLYGVTIGSDGFLIVCNDRASFVSAYLNSSAGCAPDGCTCEVQDAAGGPADSDGYDQIALVEGDPAASYSIIDIFGMSSNSVATAQGFEDGHAERNPFVLGASTPKVVWDANDWNVTHSKGVADMMPRYWTGAASPPPFPKQPPLPPQPLYPDPLPALPPLSPPPAPAAHYFYGTQYPTADCSGTPIREWADPAVPTSNDTADHTTCHSPLGTWSVRGEWCDFAWQLSLPDGWMSDPSLMQHMWQPWQPKLRGTRFANSSNCSTAGVEYAGGVGWVADGSCVDQGDNTSARVHCLASVCLSGDDSRCSSSSNNDCHADGISEAQTCDDGYVARPSPNEPQNSGRYTCFPAHCPECDASKCSSPNNDCWADGVTDQHTCRDDYVPTVIQGMGVGSTWTRYTCCYDPKPPYPPDQAPAPPLPSPPPAPPPLSPPPAPAANYFYGTKGI